MLNASMTNAMESLADAPQLKTVPGDVTVIKKDLAQLGSRLTDIESQVTSSANDLQNVQQTFKTLRKDKNSSTTPLDKVNIEQKKFAAANTNIQTS